MDEISKTRKLGLEIPTDLHQRVKVAAASRGVKMKEATEQAFESWLKAENSAAQIKDVPNDKKQTTIRVPKELHHDLKVGAAQSDMSADAFVQQAIRDKLKGVPIPDLKSYEIILETVYKISKNCDNILSVVNALEQGVNADERYRIPNQAEDELNRTLRALRSAQTKWPDDSNQGSGTSADPECGDREGAGTPKPMGKRHNPPNERRRRS